MTASPKDKAASKSDVIEGILRQHGTLPARRIVEEMQLMGVDAKPNNVRSLMTTLFNRFVSLKPGLWELWDPALSYAEKVIAYEEARGGEVSPERKDMLRALHEPRTPAVSKLRNGYMKRNTTVKDLNRLLQELEKQKESLQVKIDACNDVIALFEERPPDDDDQVTTLEAEVESADVVAAPQKMKGLTFGPKTQRVKREPAGLKAPCPRCSARAVTTDGDFSICISCGWNSSKVTEAHLS